MDDAERRAIARILAEVEHIIAMRERPRRRGRPRKLAPCRWCGELISRTEAERGHAGCTHTMRAYVRGGAPKAGTPARERRPCRYCGASVTLTEWWKGHEGCTRVKRRYTLPGRGKAKTGKILDLTREEIAAKIASMPAKQTYRLVARLGRF